MRKIFLTIIFMTLFVAPVFADDSSNFDAFGTNVFDNPYSGQNI